MEQPADNVQASGQFSFVEMEHDILKLWEETGAFQQSLENTKGKKPYIFYDGPPFATGLPHHGHLVASTIKDIVPRYWTMKGYRIERVWGWDFYGDERLVDVHIGNLRKAIGDAADEPRFVGTVRGVGYKCVARPS